MPQDDNSLYNFITQSQPTTTSSMPANEFVSYTQPQQQESNWWSNTPFDFGEGGWDTVGEIAGRLYSAPLSTFADLLNKTGELISPEDKTPLISGGNAFTKTLDVIQAPQQFLLGTGNYLLDQFQDQNATVGSEHPILALAPNKFLDYMAGGIEGVRNNTDASDVLQNALDYEQKPELFGGDTGVFSLSPKKVAALWTYAVPGMQGIASMIDPEGQTSRNFWTGSLVGQLASDPMAYVDTPMGAVGGKAKNMASDLLEKIGKNWPEFADKVQKISKYAMRSDEELKAMQLADKWEGARVRMAGEEIEGLTPVEKQFTDLTGPNKSYIEEQVMKGWEYKLDDALYNKLKGPIEQGYKAASPEAQAVIDEILTPLPIRPQQPAAPQMADIIKRFTGVDDTYINNIANSPNLKETLRADFGNEITDNIWRELTGQPQKQGLPKYKFQDFNTPQEANAKEWFHGGPNFIDRPDVYKSGPASIFGPGLYVTDDPNIAMSYAKARTNKGVFNIDRGTPVLNKLKIDVKNILDSESPAPENVVNLFRQAMGSNFEVNPNDTLATLYKRVFEYHQGESIENVYETLADLNDYTHRLGYDAIKYPGGIRTKGTRHNALVLLDPDGQYSWTVDEAGKPYFGADPTKIKQTVNYRPSVVDSVEWMDPSNVKQPIKIPAPIRNATTRAAALADLANFSMPRDQYMRTGLLLKQAREESLAKDFAMGIVTPDLADEQVDYALMLIKRQYQNKIRQALGLADANGKPLKYGVEHRSMLERSWKGLGGHAEINQRSIDGTLPGLEGIKFPGGILDMNPIKIEMVRRMRSVQSRANIGLVLDAADTLGSPTPKEGWQPVTKWLAKNKEYISPEIYNRLKGTYFHPDHIKHLEARLDMEALPDVYKTFLKGYDDAKNAWVSATLSFPSTAMKNLAGNEWNYALGGMKGDIAVKFHGLAHSIHNKTAGEVIDLGGKVGQVETRRLIDIAKDFNIETSGISSIDNAERIARYGDKGIVTPFVQKLYPVKVMKKLNRAVEDNGRLSFFLYRLSEGDSPMEASLAVKKYGLDYLTGLTDFERAVMKRIFPFYAWTRLNLPLQLEQMVTNPKPFIRLAELVNLATNDEVQRKIDTFHEDVVPQMARDAGIPIRMGPDGLPEYFMLGGWLPAADLAIFSDGPTGLLKKLYSMVNPLLTRTAESAINYDPMIGRKLASTDTGWTQRLQLGNYGVDVDKRVTNMSRIFRAINVVDQLSKGLFSNELTEKEYNVWQQVAKLLFGTTTYTANIQYGQRKITNEIKDIRWALKNARLREGEREALQERLQELQGVD